MRVTSSEIEGYSDRVCERKGCEGNEGTGACKEGMQEISV